MTRYRASGKIRKKFNFEIYFELLIVFSVTSVIAFIAPIFAGHSRRVRHNDSYFGFIDYYYNGANFYPYMALAGIIVTTLYLLAQLRKQKIIEFNVSDDEFTLVMRNSFTGKTKERIIQIPNLKFKKEKSNFHGVYYTLFDQYKYAGGFYPTIKPWIANKDEEVINSIILKLNEVGTQAAHNKSFNAMPD
ncbi:MAG TPA: hypothetical protein EYN51_01485 [Flavobacteriales bacterium]|nr:hypothetical protein [Flavobacteriales bacterium]